MRHVICELRHTPGLAQQAATDVVPGFELDLRSVPRLPYLHVDTTYAPVLIPHVRQVTPPPERWDAYDTTAGTIVDVDPRRSTFVVRGRVEDDDADALLSDAQSSERVVGVYADPVIEPALICPGAPPLGTDDDVASLLCATSVHDRRMDGRGVEVAVVDSGVNVAYLRARGLTPMVNGADSWAWDPTQVTPGEAPVGHGTMVAYDAMIMAPRATLIDVALLRPISAPPGGSLIEGVLSDAIRAYAHLTAIAQRPTRPGANRSLVVNNSWGMFHPSWDFPPGDPRNYSDNPAHPFNRIVATLERAGADILFAAGNCGPECPDRRCRRVTDRAIYGANSHPAVLTVAGVDTTGTRVGYSSTGPGRLEDRKPDIAGYTHFSGSGVSAADGGTSAAAPVVAGVVAALRSRRPFDPDDPMTRPAAMRSLLSATARDISPTGFDYETGHGVVDACQAADRIVPPVPRPEDRWRDFSRRYPVFSDVLRGLWATTSTPAAEDAANDPPPGLLAAIDPLLGGPPESAAPGDH